MGSVIRWTQRRQRSEGRPTHQVSEARVSRQNPLRHTNPEYKAGFFDPGFGYGEHFRGTRAVLEVRAHDVPFMLEDGQPIARLTYESMAEPPDRLYGDAELTSHFQGQELNLSRQFRPLRGAMKFQFLNSE